MQVDGITLEDVLDVLEDVSTQCYGGNVTVRTSSDTDWKRKRGTSTTRPLCALTLRTRSSRGRGAWIRTTFEGKDRRTIAACWHVHRDFLATLFDRYPTARVSTAFADYRGREDFLEKFEATGWKNVGSMMYPMSASQCCDCNDPWVEPTVARRSA